MKNSGLNVLRLIFGAGLLIFSLFTIHAQANSQRRDGSRDFDFEIGTWKTHVHRLLHPMTGSNEWTDYEGTSVINKVWAGKANLVELEVSGPAGHIEGLSLRLYDPSARQWSLNFASSASGILSTPTVGDFRDGVGAFYDQERIGGRQIIVRNTFSQITATSDRFEQAFSDDGGLTWEINWIATDDRIQVPNKVH